MYSEFVGTVRGAILGLALAAALVGPAAAQGSAPGIHAGPLTISDVWARATPPGARTGAVYMVVTNDGSGPDRLIGGVTPAAATVELHSHMLTEGVARMQPIAAVEVSPGEPAVFQPGGLHVMLVDLKAPLRDDTTFPLTLRFARAGNVTFDVPVRRTAPPGQAPAEHQHRH